MSRLTIMALITLCSVPITGYRVPNMGIVDRTEAIPPTSGPQPRIVTCTIQKDTATGNSRSEVAYYECRQVNGAVIPSVMFIVVTDAPGDLWLRQLEGRTVDVTLQVVK